MWQALCLITRPLKTYTSLVLRGKVRSVFAQSSWVVSESSLRPALRGCGDAQPCLGA
jgi:hypothetical protein